MERKIALIIFIILLSWVVPTIVQKYKLKDDIKHTDTLPIGTAQFKGFMKLVKWVLIVFLFLLMITWTLHLLGVDI